MITITGLGDHDRPDWLITMTGIRSGALPASARAVCPTEKVLRWRRLPPCKPKWPFLVVSSSLFPQLARTPGQR